MALQPGRTRQELEALAEIEAQRQGVPVQLVKAVIDRESNWNPNAVSPRGARGLMQLMPITAREMGVTNVNDPAQNIRGGVGYLRKQLNRYGDTGLALTAYNWGPRHAAQVEADPRGARIPKETLKFVPDVYARMRKYGPMLQPSALTLGLYPLMSDVLADESLTSVREKLGLAKTPQIERSIKTGNTPIPRGPAREPTAPAAPSPPPALPGAAAPAPAATLGEQSAAPMEGEILAAGQPGYAPPPPPTPGPPGEAQLGGEEAALTRGPQLAPARARQLPAVRPTTAAAKNYLRLQYGPLAELADPFPSAYDGELDRMIDRA